MVNGRKTGNTGGDDSDRKHLPGREVERLIEATKGSRNEARDRCLLLLMFRHGLRVSEACRMKLDQVDRQNQSGRRRGVDEEVSEKSLRNGANEGYLVPAKAVWRSTGSLALKPMQERLRAEANGDILVRRRKAKRKFRIEGGRSWNAENFFRRLPSRQQSHPPPSSTPRQRHPPIPSSAALSARPAKSSPSSASAASS